MERALVGLRMLRQVRKVGSVVLIALKLWACSINNMNVLYLANKTNHACMADIGSRQNPFCISR